MLEIKGSTAVITGAASGIGAAMAAYWIERGGRAVLGDANRELLEKTAAGYGNSALMLHCDVRDEESVASMARAAVETYGSINLVFPCAGIIKDGLTVSVDRGTGKVDGKMSLDQFQSVLDVNLTGVFLTIRECLEQMVNSGSSGLVCLVSSLAAAGNMGQINYSSSKAAVSVMPMVLTAELARRGLAGRIRCVAIEPGFVRTPILEGMNRDALAKLLTQVPLGRMVEPEEVASLVAELYRNEALMNAVYPITGGVRL